MRRKISLRKLEIINSFQKMLDKPIWPCYTQDVISQREAAYDEPNICKRRTGFRNRDGLPCLGWCRMPTCKVVMDYAGVAQPVE